MDLSRADVPLIVQAVTVGTVLHMLGYLVGGLVVGLLPNVMRETARALAARSVGLQLIILGLRPLIARRGDDGWSVRFMRSSSTLGCSGFRLQGVPDQVAIPALRRIVLAGPAANFVAAAILLPVVYWMIVSPRVFEESFLVVAGLFLGNLTTGLMCLIPMRSGFLVSDVLAFQILGRPREARHLVNLSRAAELGMGDSRPREWGTGDWQLLIDTAWGNLGDEAALTARLYSASLLELAYVDAGRPDHAMQVVRFVETWPDYASAEKDPMLSGMRLLEAYLVATWGADPLRAMVMLGTLGRTGPQRQASLFKATEAAIELAMGQVAAARTSATRAVALAERFPFPMATWVAERDLARAVLDRVDEYHRSPPTSLMVPPAERREVA